MGETVSVVLLEERKWSGGDLGRWSVRRMLSARYDCRTVESAVRLDAQAELDPHSEPQPVKITEKHGDTIVIQFTAKQFTGEHCCGGERPVFVAQYCAL